MNLDIKKFRIYYIVGQSHYFKDKKKVSVVYCSALYMDRFYDKHSF